MLEHNRVEYDRLSRRQRQVVIIFVPLGVIIVLTFPAHWLIYCVSGYLLAFAVTLLGLSFRMARVLWRDLKETRRTSDRT